MKQIILLNTHLLFLLICICVGAATGNFRRGGKVSPSKIIFPTDEHEPLLPRPTFSSNVKPPRFRTPGPRVTVTGPPKKFVTIPRSPTPEWKRPGLQTPPPVQSQTPRPSEPTYGGKSTRTTPRTSSSSTIITSKSGSNSYPSVTVDPILDGSFYVPFRMMKMNNETRSS